jgi:hypothetical protein
VQPREAWSLDQGAIGPRSGLPRSQRNRDWDRAGQPTLALRSTLVAVPEGDRVIS